MKKHAFRVVFYLAFAALGLGFGAGPVLALYAPCRYLTVQQAGTTVTYKVTDPVSGQERQESWALTIGDEAVVESLTAEGGIVAWIAKYRWTGDTDYYYAVHYRIFDPGRGVWKGGVWGWFTSGANRRVTSLIVKDGVVAWKSKHQLSTNPTDLIEHAVHYATYNPTNGSWPLGEDTYRVAYISPVAPENLRVKNGLVAWPMDPANNQNKVDIFSRIYDPELNQWMGGFFQANMFGSSFDWIQIVDDTAQVQIRYSSAVESFDMWLAYDPHNHSWHTRNSTQPRPQPIRRPFFTAQPASGFVPFWACFWDTSIALSDGNFWSWSFGDGGTSYERSPVHRYNLPGTHSVNQTVSYGGTNYLANGVVQAQTYTPPTGGIQINGGAAYTNSLNVTLNLNYSPTATQMRFYEWPGLDTGWQNIAPSRAYQCYGGIGDGLRTIYAKFRDVQGIESNWYQAEITVDTTPPAPMLILNYGQDTTRNRNIRVEWNAIDANGVAQMHYTAFDEGDNFFLWTLWMDYQSTVMTIPFSARPGKKTVIVEFMDVAGNIISVQDSTQLVTTSMPFIPLLLGE
jgi:PKD repeat protein